ncbi:thioredoxin [Nitzschia inconspicua]|uniref:Thioredoxin n=1 Tax=Nitzschia inconspicua TaxID=303405 RepID=A0A9K3PI10_9STRA|nr:thioredoxin [Nitzschia inconspicua]
MNATVGRSRFLPWLILFVVVAENYRKTNLWCCSALSSSSPSSPSSSSASVSTFPTTRLLSTTKSQLAILDGGEWNSVQSILQDEWKAALTDSRTRGDTIRSTKYGYMKVVTGRDSDDCRVVAMQCLEDDKEDINIVYNIVYQDSVAMIPDKISDEDAIATYVIALSCVHCALPKLENVGGGTDSIATGKAVVLGCSEVACFAAEGLASLGIEVFLVNNKGTANVKNRKIQVITPAIGSSDVGFSAHVGQFDSLVDTIGNERSSSLSMDDPIGDNDFYDIGLSFGSSVLQLLRNRHNCQTYVSTFTNCQQVVANEGIFGGPGKAEQYCEKIGNLSILRKNKDSRLLPPPKSLGNTIETLLKAGTIFTEKQRRKLCSKKSNAIRGWSLADFWEATSWPRDASGTGTIRFGLPVRDDPTEEDVEVEFMISESPYRQEQARAVSTDSDYDDIGDFGLKEAKKSASSQNRAFQNNPYVLNVLGVDGLQSEIVDTKMDCIMFMSAKFCKTCRTINPLYTRMARLHQERDGTTVSFVKAEASGESGKALGRHLSVQAVPSFVLFREGRQFGVPLSVSKLPSRKIDRALELLETGAPWDGSILDEDEPSSSSS